MVMLRPLFVSFGSLALLTGLVYPAAITGIARVAFPRQAGGSLLFVDGTVRGSSLIGQATEAPGYFWGRPSATNLFPTNAAASAGSTLALSNPALAEAVARRAQALRALNPGNVTHLPQDLVTASASGLDPHLSPEGARWQIPRVARARGLEPSRVQALVTRHVQTSLFAPSRVNVLELNLALDAEARQ